jgi:SAM-dependent methyltransferase
MSAIGYAFDNDAKEADDHHGALEELLNGITISRVNQLVKSLRGKRCWDVGAGAGSIAEWFAEEVGPEGSVLATDLKPHRIKPRAQLQVLQHDITTDELPGDLFDVIHARLLLNHLPSRLTVLHRLVSHLAPGGLLVTSDFWPVPAGEFVVKAPTIPDASLLRRYHEKHMQVLAEHGNDRGWSRYAYNGFLHEGLVDVETVTNGGIWRGGSAGCRLLLAGIGQLRTELESAGLLSQELGWVEDLLVHRGVAVEGHVFRTTSGRLPGLIGEEAQG